MHTAVCNEIHVLYTQNVCICMFLCWNIRENDRKICVFPRVYEYHRPNFILSGYHTTQLNP